MVTPPHTDRYMYMYPPPHNAKVLLSLRPCQLQTPCGFTFNAFSAKTFLLVSHVVQGISGVFVHVLWSAFTVSSIVQALIVVTGTGKQSMKQIKETGVSGDKEPQKILTKADGNEVTTNSFLLASSSTLKFPSFIDQMKLR